MRTLSLVSAALLATFASLPLAADASPLTRTSILRTADTGAAAPATEARARAVLAREAPNLAPLSFGKARIHSLRSGRRVVRLPQLHGGIPVIGRGAVVAFSPAGAPRLVTSTVEEDLPAVLTPKVTKAAAIATAEGLMRMRATPSRAALVLWPSPDAVVLAWAVHAPSAGLPSAPTVIVDALTGEPIASFNAIRDLNEASVYPSNPTKSPTRIDVTLPVAAGHSTLHNDLVHSQNCIDNKTVKPISEYGFSLDVHVCDLVQTATPNADGDYDVEPSDDTDPEDSFAEVSMFYHVNHAYEYFRGFEPGFKVMDGPLNTISNLRMPDGYATQNVTKMADPELPLVPFQNAFFSPADPLFGGLFGVNEAAIWFGQGPRRDYSYDGDVIYHEFTHAVVAATLDLIARPHFDEYGTSYSPGSMNEGLADYFAAAISGDPDIGEYASQDVSLGASAIRTLDNDDACPGSIGGEVHQDSTLFSGGLWAVRASLDTPKQLAYDEAIFVAMQTASSGDLGYEELVELIAASIEDSADLGQAVADALRSEFTARGVLPHCQRVIEYIGAAVSGPDGLYGMFVAPGTLTAGSTVKGYAPGIVQLHQSFPLGAKTIELAADIHRDGGGFGGGTPFTPKVLVSFNGAPVQFRYRPFVSDDTTLFDATVSGSTMSASIDVPEGATDAYVMIVNAGQSDGYYTSVQLELTGVPTDPGGSGAGGGDDGAGGGAGPSDGDGGGDVVKEDPLGTVLEADGGCGVAPGGPAGGYAALGLLGLAFAAARRRRGR